MKKVFVREKKIYCGKDWLEIDCFIYSDVQAAAVKQRGIKSKLTEPKQTSLNDKNARRYLTQLTNSNFDESDFHISATYGQNNLPATPEEAEKISGNFLRRIAYRCKKLGIPPIKYISVTETNSDKDGTLTRVHHHIILKCGLGRDEIENLWRNRREKGQKVGAKIGYINADRLQMDNGGAAALCDYLTKSPVRKKRWSSSQNLIKPWSRANDSRYSRRKLEELAKNPPEREFWEKQYKGYELTGGDYGFQAIYSEQSGWAIYLKMRRKTTTCQNEKQTRQKNTKSGGTKCQS